MNAQEWKIESFFLNIGLGDSAIHLRINITNNEVQGAVLIDGGLESAANTIENAIRNLRILYGNFEFTGIIVTHWDGDHYGGVLRLLLRDITQNTVNNLAYIGQSTIFYCPARGCMKMNPNFILAQDDFCYQQIPPGGTNPTIHRLCRVVLGVDCIGVDFWTGRRIGQGHVQIPRFADLYINQRSLPHGWENEPIFLCVGCDDEFISNPTLEPIPLAYHKPPGVGEDVLNKSSIILISIWHKPHHQNPDRRRITLYTAGDAEEPEELEVLEWLKEIPGQFHKPVIDVLKPGHHGSAKSTPEDLVKFNTKFFIISAADGHGHPSFALLFFLMAYAHSNMYAEDELKYVRIYATCYPYWLIKPDELMIKKDCNIAHVLSYDAGSVKLMKAIISITKQDYITKWLSNASPHIRNIYSLKNTPKQLDTLKDKENTLGAGVGVPKDQLQGKTVDGEWSSAVQKVVDILNSIWPSVGFPQVPDDQIVAIRVVAHDLGVQASHRGIDSGPINQNDVFEFREFELNLSDGIDLGDDQDKSESLHRQVLSRKSKIIRRTGFKKNAKDAIDKTKKKRDNSGANADVVDGTTVDISIPSVIQTSPTGGERTKQTENWIKEFLTKGVDWRQLSSGKSKGASLDSSNSQFCRWISAILNERGVITVLEGTPSGDTTILESISIQVGRKENSDRTLEPLIVFNNAALSRQEQFGSENIVSQTEIGFDGRFNGIVLALDRSQSRDISFPDFVSMFGIKIASWTNSLFQKLNLSFDPDPRAQANNQDRKSRCGLWLKPGETLESYLRLEAYLDLSGQSAIDELNDFLSGSLGSLKVRDVVVRGSRSQETVGIRKGSASPVEIKNQSCLSLEASLEMNDKDLKELFSARCNVSFSDIGFQLHLKMNSDANLLDALVTLIQRSFPSTQNTRPAFLPENNVTPAEQIKGIISRVTFGLNHFYFHSISFGFSSTEKKLKSCEVKLEIPLGFGAGGTEVPLIASFSWSSGTFVISGELYDSLAPTALPFELQPMRERINELNPFTSPYADAISIPYLLGNIGPFPAGIPDLITAAKVTLRYGNSSIGVSIEGSIECSPPPPESAEDNGRVPILLLEEVDLYLNLNYALGEKKYLQDFDIKFRASITIDPSPAHRKPEELDMQLDIMVEYKKTGGENASSQWTISAGISNVRIAQLYELFAADGGNHAIMDIMSEIIISHASVEYQYSSGQPAQLVIAGSMLLGPLQLDLSYVHAGVNWAFHGKLMKNPNTNLKDPKLGELLAPFMDNTQTDPLPAVIRDLVLPLSKLEISLGCSKIVVKGTSGKRDTSYVVFCLSVKIDKFTATFAQIRPYGVDVPKQVGAARLIRFALSSIPGPEKIPVLNKMKQPFDQLGLVWTNRDISSSELEVLNEHVFPPESPLLVKSSQISNGKPQSKSDSIAMLAGAHFQLALQEQSKSLLILDYLAGGKKKVGSKQEGSNALAQESPRGETTMVPMAKTIGPLTIRNIGLRVDKLETIVVILDASVRLGPVTFALLGFSISLPLKDIMSLDGLMHMQPHVSVRGMAVKVEKPPARIAGMFASFNYKDRKGYDVNGYSGAIAVALGAWSAIAGGMYEEHVDFKSLFVFGIIRGPIAQFGSAQINGLTGGFGYNSHLELPAVEEVEDYPFIALNNENKTAGDGILAQLAFLTAPETGRAWVTAAKDSLWFIGGVGIRAFQVLDVVALFALQISADPKFGIIAQATAIFPKRLQLGISDENDPYKGAFVVLDLGLVASVDPTHGILSAAGQLTPRSFILSQSCKLTGGFALLFFLPGNEHEGEFCFTIGGYHPNYIPPAHYPPAPPRVGISWQYDAQLRISGEAYFAVTPQCAMGGGRLDAVIDKGWIHASFSAYAHFFVQFHPFWFDIDVAFNIYARVDAPVLLGGTYGPCEFSATVKLYGPPMAGRASLNFWMWNLTVCFGPGPKPADPLNLMEFVLMVKEEEPNAKQKKADTFFSVTRGAIASDNTGIPTKDRSLSIESLNGEEKPVTKAPPTRVRNVEFQFTIETRFPVKTATLNKRTLSTRNHVEGQNIVEPEIYALPMQRETSIAVSNLTITITRRNQTTLLTMSEIHLQETPILKPLAPAMWGKYKTTYDSTVTHAMGYSFELGTGTRSNENLPVISVIDFNSEDVLQRDDESAPKLPWAEKPNPKTIRAFNPYVSKTNRHQVNFEDEAQSIEFKGQVIKAWGLFKKKYSHGGRHQELSTPALLERTKQITGTV